MSDLKVVVAGAGLAGLSAAHDLRKLGAEVTVIDSRDRVGGRTWTIRDGFLDGQHAEAGGDMIDGTQSEILGLAEEVGLTLTRILRGGFAYVREDRAGRPRIVTRHAMRGWERLSESLSDLIRRHRLAERRWDSPIAADLARQSVAQWLDAARADGELRETAVGLRGFFLTDPNELSLLALVDEFAEFAEDDAAWPGKMFRIRGGNDRLASTLAGPLGDHLKLGTELVAVSHRGPQVRLSLTHARSTSQVTCDYLVLALPATTLRRIPITPALPAPQHEAIARLKYGRATKTLMQFSRPFWRAAGPGRVFGSPLPFGAAWDGNEGQRGHPGILTLLAGGAASDATQTLTAKGGVRLLADSLSWLDPGRAELVASRQVSWEHDAWARGGYAYFDPAFDPAHRAWLARPCGRLFFAGEHTSVRWQGYMNGAVESGRRAAAEIAATDRMNGR